MTLLMAEGFTLLPQDPTKNDSRSTSPLTQMGWELGEAAAASVTEEFTKFNIIPDETFPDRNVLKVGAIANSSTGRGVYFRYNIPEDRVPDKLLVGAVVRYVLSTTTARVSFYPAFGTINMKKVTTTGGSIQDLHEGLWIATATGTAAGSALPNSMGTLALCAYWDKPGGYQNFDLVSGRDYHVETLIERDSGRIRTYIDGQLIVDYTYEGIHQEDLTKGFTFWQGGSSTPTGNYGLYSNIYAIAIDEEHPGPLGPATRVLEVPPKDDIVAQFSRDEAQYSSNAEILQNTLLDDAFLMGGNIGQHDILSLDNEKIKANSAAIHGVVAKFIVNNLDAEDHAVGLTYGNGEEQVAPDNHDLTPTKMTIAYRDISIDPVTGATWTPDGITNLTVGYTVNA